MVQLRFALERSILAYIKPFENPPVQFRGQWL